MDTLESASAWAREHSLAADVRLARVEIIAFRRHPEIYRYFGPDGAVTAARALTARRPIAARAGNGIVALLAVVGVIAPVAAVSAMGGDRFNFFRMDASQSVPLAGALFAVTALTQLVVLLMWLRKGARFDGFTLGIVVVALVFSGFGLIGMVNAGALDGYDGWGAWYPAVIAAFLISAGSAIAMMARRRHRVPEAVAQPAQPTEGPQAAQAALRGLGDAELDAIRADRDAALHVLGERGILDPETVARARAADLGTLYLLDPPLS
ncbi:hypothetical protein [Microbacterium lushaniae]|uniref:Uncharacterized protein n=1 Tax=Microbacterium lushaniae TaxID=2614639 RepID=A0A5J6KZP3_9MICO|nr:hypothetical protein [Microbacterium lushaniae]QEW01704.1 hypothetical protein F6J85_00395 [Microbacterium lushaniae]